MRAGAGTFRCVQLLFPLFQGVHWVAWLFTNVLQAKLDDQLASYWELTAQELGEGWCACLGQTARLDAQEV